MVLVWSSCIEFHCGQISWTTQKNLPRGYVHRSLAMYICTFHSMLCTSVRFALPIDSAGTSEFYEYLGPINK